MAERADERGELLSLLQFYRDAGVTDAVEEAAVDRFALADLPPPILPAEPQTSSQRPARTSLLPQQPAAPPKPRAVPAVPDEGQAALAREQAAAARTLDELKAAMEAFNGCNLKFTAKNIVFADGDPQADLMLVGEAPGRDEDIEGLPFVGRSGQLLDRMLKAIGRDRASAYVANVLPWRPPGNRTPTPLETEICRPFIERQIELANPRVLVALGGSSAKVLLRTADGIMRLRGGWQTYVTPGGTEIPIMPTLHPAYLLRNPAHKKLAWRDFLEVKARLRALGGG
ncbi:MAG TPA: uracil-DNA glycosylase [Mesorhizobium sp.]|jgi:DNA polymerase|nr:uracil-DNA glycosylase [Mesorhizobium sp.]